MLSIILVLILALHAAPFGLNLTEDATYDLYNITNLLIHVLLAGCLAVKAMEKWEKIFSSLVLVVGVFFLLNYVSVIVTDPSKNEVYFVNELNDEQKQ